MNSGKKWMFILYALALTATMAAEPNDTILELDEVVATAPLKLGANRHTLPLAKSTFTLTDLERTTTLSAKDLSTTVPNFYIPDYGSSMTSTIYIRGLGARIDQPVMGMNVDNIPYLDKNLFDFDFFDLRRVEVLRGPQGTLYGRNTMGGLMNITTLSPMLYTGLRAALTYGTGNTWRMRMSAYQQPKPFWGYALAATYKHTDGYFRNTYNNKLCDAADDGSLRIKFTGRHNGLTWNNTLTGGLLRQGGYAYAMQNVETNTRQPIAYNDDCGYRRAYVIEGLTLNYAWDKLRLLSTTSYQMLADRMNLDQDFTPQSIFTLEQKQQQHALTQDLVLSSTQRDGWYSWLTGLWAFGKHNRMNAPVTFLREGIEQLILDNANNGMHHVFPDDSIDIAEQQFTIDSDFQLGNVGVALYHQSNFRWARWTISAGLRLDYEHASMRYTNGADVHYRFSLLMPSYKAIGTHMAGHEASDFLSLLPKLSVTYALNKRNSLYAYAAKGYKAGGYNTQIFSTIIQNRMMMDMMADVGVHIDGFGNERFSSADITSYRPEYAWNYELGGHFGWKNCPLLIDAALFYIDCRDQQLTVFPEGKTTGRMMTNAGRTRSYGAELSASYLWKSLTLQASYGYTNARFVHFDDGTADYAGNYVPYSPQQTASVSANYAWNLPCKRLHKIEVNASWQGVGRIFWDEANAECQPFYSLVDASTWLCWSKMRVGLWGKNLTNTSYDTFRFVSMSNSFFQKGKPLQAGVSIQWNM